MDAKEQDSWRTAIVLQGGGAMGAYEFGVLKALYETRSRQKAEAFKPTVVAGISIGAITAAVLVGSKGDPIENLEKLWTEDFTVSGPLPELSMPFFPLPKLHQYFAMYLAMFGNNGMYQLDPTNFFTPSTMTSIYSTLPLRTTLSKRVSFDLINRSETHLVVGAINVKTGEFTPFDNRNQKRPLRVGDVLASGSLPVVFPVTRILNDSYWDAGLLWNTPLSPAINALEGCDEGSREVKRELIVVELFPLETKKLPVDMKDIIARVVQLLFSSKLKLDAKLFDQINAFIELSDKIDRVLQKENQSDILNDPAYKKLREKRKIDAFKILTCNLGEEMSNPADFSKSTLEYRIKKGYEDAIAQGIGDPAFSKRPAHLMSTLQSEKQTLSRLRNPAS